MSTMNVSLPDELKSFVDERVGLGGFGSTSEYVRDLIRRDQERAQDIDDLKRLISGDYPETEKPLDA